MMTAANATKIEAEEVTEATEVIETRKNSDSGATKVRIETSIGNNSQAGNFQAAAIIALVLSLCSYPLMLCGGWCCAPFPLLAIILGIVGYMNIPEIDKTNRMLSLAAILLSGGALVLLGCFSVLGVSASLLSSFR